MLKFETSLHENIFQKLQWLIGFSILAYLVYVIHPVAIWAILKGIDWRFIPIWIILYMVILFLGATNIYLLLRPLAPVDFWILFRYDIVATSLGYFTPAQVGGPISLAVSLRDKDVKFSQSTSVLLLDKTISLFVACGLGVVGVQKALESTPIIYIGARLSCFLELGILSLLMIGILYLLVRKLKVVQWLEERGLSVVKCLALYRYHWKYLVLNLFVSIVVQCGLSLIWVTSFDAIGKTVYFTTMITTVPAINVIAYLPITIAGLGTQEVTAIALWKHVGISGGEALSAFVFSRVLTLLTSLVFLSLNVKLWPKIDQKG